MMSRTRDALYSLFRLLVALILALMAGLLLAAPGLAAAYDMAALTGLAASGLTLTADSTRSGRLPRDNRLHTWAILWTAFCGVGLLAAFFGAGDGVRALAALLILALLIGVGRDAWAADFGRVWWLGTLAAVGWLSADALTGAPAWADLRWLAAYPAASVGVLFWLMRRFGHVDLPWARRGARICAALIALAGTLVSLSPLIALGGWVAPLIFACVGIVAAHSYRAFSNRTPSPALSAHWAALTVVLWLLSIGGLGAVMAPATIRDAVTGSLLVDLQAMLARFAILALMLGALNQAVMEWRGIRRRITGLLPFWCVTFGLIGGGCAYGAAGIVQVYGTRIFALDPDRVFAALWPLLALWRVGLVAVALGMVAYALGFRARSLP